MLLLIAGILYIHRFALEVQILGFVVLEKLQFYCQRVQ
jgi:hypothetical protein